MNANADACLAMWNIAECCALGSELLTCKAPCCILLGHRHDGAAVDIALQLISRPGIRHAARLSFWLRRLSEVPLCHLGKQIVCLPQQVICLQEVFPIPSISVQCHRSVVAAEHIICRLVTDKGV